MSNSPLLNVMKQSMQKAGRALARDFGEIENLQGNRHKLEAFVGHAKKNAEDLLLEELELVRPGYGYISSIGENKTKTKERWLISIINGEENYLRSIPHWSMSLALEDDNGTIAGVVYDVVRNETYFAQKGYGAFVNNRRLKPRDVKDLNGAVIFSTFNAETCSAPAKRMEQGKALYNSCVSSIHNMGSVALDICYIASAKGDVFFSNKTTSYEVAAAGIIAKEAGLFVSSLKGQRDFVYEKTMVATFPSLHGSVLKILNIK